MVMWKSPGLGPLPRAGTHTSLAHTGTHTKTWTTYLSVPRFHLPLDSCVLEKNWNEGMLRDMHGRKCFFVPPDASVASPRSHREPRGPVRRHAGAAVEQKTGVGGRGGGQEDKVEGSILKGTIENGQGRI